MSRLLCPLQYTKYMPYDKMQPGSAYTHFSQIGGRLFQRHKCIFKYSNNEKKGTLKKELVHKERILNHLVNEFSKAA